jgi:hypothetical protein
MTIHIDFLFLLVSTAQELIKITKRKKITLSTTR